MVPFEVVGELLFFTAIIFLETAAYISTYCPIQACKCSLQMMVSACQVKSYQNLLFRVSLVVESSKLKTVSSTFNSRLGF